MITSVNACIKFIYVNIGSSTERIWFLQTHIFFVTIVNCDEHDLIYCIKVLGMALNCNGVTVI